MDKRQNQQNQQRGQAQSAGRQQGGQSGAGQQQQFDTQGSQQAGGSATTSRFGAQIREHMEVVDAKGAHCGTVDHVEGDRIKLTRSDSPKGEHQYVPMSQVAGIEGNQVHLRERGDNDFGMEA